MECQNHNFHYYPATNEDGWRCVDCNYVPGEPPGYAPQLDRELIELKVGGLLMDIADSALVHVSNSSGADAITAAVVVRCKARELYDQYSILLFLLELLTSDHAEYWRKIGDGIIAGADPRSRCRCGKLASLYVGGKEYCGYPCLDADAE